MTKKPKTYKSEVIFNKFNKDIKSGPHKKKKIFKKKNLQKKNPKWENIEFQ